MTQKMMPAIIANRFAMIDTLAVVAMSTKPNVSLAQGIATASGKSPGFAPAGAAAALLTDARSHHESLAFVVDIGSMLGKPSMPFMTSLGFDNARAQMRMVVPSASIKAVVP